ncbi:hypothetical protein BHM03_00043545 [Ensete ventricosum]|nr:hypothetical protein BHM03_00043545 [Ensete ventricosum]
MVVVRDHFHSSSPFPKPLDLASRSFHLHLLLPSFHQAGMVSSPSFSVSSFSSTRSSLVPPPREEEYRPSDSLGDQSGPQSSSSGVMVGADAKALQAMKSHHDFDSTVSLESLASIRKCFSILNEYVLHTLGPGQRSYHSCPGGFSISIDALEAGLRLPLHPVIGECLGWWWISPGQVAPNPWCYIITFLREYKGSGIVPTWDLFLSCFRLCRGQGGYYLTSRAGQRKKDWCKSLRKANRAVTKGKGPVDVPEEPPAPRRKPKSVKELCSASAGVDDRDYHAIRMCNLPEKAPDAPLEADLRPLTQGMLGQLRGVRTQVRQIEIELLELTRSKDALQEDLPRRAIEDYKKSPGFEMGLVALPGLLRITFNFSDPSSGQELHDSMVSGSSLPCVRPSSEAAVGLGRELAMKLSSNSLVRWSKDEMEDDFSRLYHIRAGPLWVVGKRPPLVLSEGDFIFTGEEVARTFGFTPAVTSLMAELYGELVGAVVWGEDMMCHAALMACGGGVGWHSVWTLRPRMLTSEAIINKR